MIPEILAQVPDSIDAETAKWIIGGLIGFIGTMFLFFKWAFGKVEKAGEIILGRVDKMHSEGISELRQIKENYILHDAQVQTKLGENSRDIIETKYAIQTLNTKVKCIEK